MAGVVLRMDFNQGDEEVVNTLVGLLTTPVEGHSEDKNANPLKVPKVNAKPGHTNSDELLEADVTNLLSALETPLQHEGEKENDNSAGGVDSSAVASKNSKELPCGVERPAGVGKRGQVQQNVARKKHRKHYTDREKELVILADAQGGRQNRLWVANLIGMPAATADNLLKLSRKGLNPEHDKRHDGHGGRQSMRKPYHENLLLERLHANEAVTLSQLQAELNRETLRHVLIENNVAISEEEKRAMGPLDMEKYLSESSEAVRQAFEHKRIRSVQTVSNWLNGMIITKKHHATERTSANSPAVMSRRLSFCKLLQATLVHESFFYVFIDEMPFYLAIHRSLGRTKGERAMEMIPPGGTLRTQVAMAIHPSIGLLHGECFPPEKRTTISRSKESPDYQPEECTSCEQRDVGDAAEEETQPQDKRKQRREKTRKPMSVFKPVWGKRKFTEFLDHVLQRLAERKAEISNKTVVIVVDGAPEHGPEASFPNLLKSCPSFDPLMKMMKESGGSIRLLRLPAYSPQLNLCEYYNRTLRTLANREWNTEEMGRSLLENSARGQEIQRQLDVLQDILERCLDKIRLRHAESKRVQRLMEFIQLCITAQGYLNDQEPL